MTRQSRLALSIVFQLVCYTLAIGILIGGCIAQIAQAGTTDVIRAWRNPDVREDSTALTNLDHIETYLTQCGKAPLQLNFPAVGAEGDSMTAAVAVETGHCFSHRFYTVDSDGNRSLYFEEITFAVPLVEIPVGPGGVDVSYYHGSKNNPFGQQFGADHDSTIDHSWGLGPPLPGAPVDSFCARFTGKIRVPASGVTMLYVKSGDGIRLWVDGTKIIDNWIYTFPQTWDKAVSLAPGQYDVLLEYFNNVGEAMCVMSWSGPGMARRTINAEEWR